MASLSDQLAAVYAKEDELRRQLAGIKDQLSAVYAKEDELRRQSAGIKESEKKLAEDRRVLTDLLLAEGSQTELALQRSPAACNQEGVAEYGAVVLGTDDAAYIEEADEQTADVIVILNSMECEASGGEAGILNELVGLNRMAYDALRAEETAAVADAVHSEDAVYSEDAVHREKTASVADAVYREETAAVAEAVYSEEAVSCEEWDEQTADVNDSGFKMACDELGYGAAVLNATGDAFLGDTADAAYSEEGEDIDDAGVVDETGCEGPADVPPWRRSRSPQRSPRPPRRRHHSRGFCSGCRVIGAQ
jgi:hypothetical protein